MNPNQNEQIPYVSSAPDFAFAPVDKVKPEEEEELLTMQAVMKLLADRRSYYNSRQALTYGIDLTVENQLIIHTKMELLIQELETMISSTIIKVEEKQRGMERTF